MEDRTYPGKDLTDANWKVVENIPSASICLLWSCSSPLEIATKLSWAIGDLFQMRSLKISKKICQGVEGQNSLTDFFHLKLCSAKYHPYEKNSPGALLTRQCCTQPFCGKLIQNLFQIRLGADICLKDNNIRNVLHLVVMNGGRLEDFAASCKVS